MGLRFEVDEAREGKAHLLVPRVEKGGMPADRARSKAPVFYNPIMRLNRDTAVLMAGIHASGLDHQLEACEPMCGSGVRGVRLALEAGALTRLGDLNPSAIRLAEENIKRNDVGGSVVCRVMEANMLMNLHASPMNRFDYVDVDPYGTPAPFLDSAIRCTKDEGLLALTATDMAPLCGVNPSACLRKYGGRPLRSSYTHEVALRLLIHAGVRAAALHEIGAVPLFAYSSDHYVRAYLRLGFGARKVDAALEQLGFVLHCTKCLHRIVQVGSYLKTGLDCPVCGNGLEVGGPMWLGEYADPGTVDELTRRGEADQKLYDARLLPLLRLIRGEIGLPVTFYDIDEESRRLHTHSRSLAAVVDNLRAGGYRAVPVHFRPRGVKTDAPQEALRVALANA